MRKILKARMVPFACAVLVAAAAGMGCSDDDDDGPVDPGNHETIELELVSGYDDIANTWPGPDGLIGTADDSVQASASASAGSETNNVQSFSYTAFDFGGATTETGLLPTGFIAASFMEGGVTVDHTALDEGGGPIIVSLEVFGGTEPTTGHGDYTASFTEVNSGTYDPITKEFTLNVDFTASLLAGSASAVNLTLSGEAWIIHEADFGDETGNAYIDSVLLPLADSLGAADLFYAEATGTVPASTPPGLFPAMPIRTVIVATHTD